MRPRAQTAVPKPRSEWSRPPGRLLAAFNGRHHRVAARESRLAEPHGDEPAGGDAAEWVFACFAGAEEEGESVAAAQLQPGGGAEVEGGVAVRTGRLLGVWIGCARRESFGVESSRRTSIVKNAASSLWWSQILRRFGGSQARRFLLAHRCRATNRAHYRTRRGLRHRQDTRWPQARRSRGCLAYARWRYHHHVAGTLTKITPVIAALLTDEHGAGASFRELSASVLA